MSSEIVHYITKKLQNRHFFQKKFANGNLFSVGHL